MSHVLEALCVLAELTGTEWSKPTIRVIEQELSAYPQADVFTAIRRCQTECRQRVTLADILDRLPNQHPGVEQAWGSIAKILNNEHASICWTDEMREAYGAAAPLAADPVAARMAFKEVYTKLLRESRATRRLPKWSVSLGWDKSLREECAREAQRRNLITQAQAEKCIGYDSSKDEAQRLMTALQVKT